MHAAMPLTPRRAVSTARRLICCLSGRLRESERGQNMVEFAFVIPMLAIFMFAAVEFGNMFRTQIELDQAVRTGTRYLSLNPASSWSTVYSNAMKSMAPDLSNVTGTVSAGTCPSTTAEVTVSASYAYAAITPVGALLKNYGGSLNSSYTLTSKSTMHEEC